MVQHSNNFDQLVDLDPVLESIFFQEYAQFQPMLIGPVFGERTSGKAKETSMRIGSFGDPQPWNGQVYYDTAERGYEKEFRHVTYTNGFKVDLELMEDLQYEGIFDSAGNLGQSFSRKVVKDEASVFNNAFTAGATAGYDAVALCSASHPRSLTDATSVSNTLGTKALNSANLEEAIVQLQGLGDDRGNEINSMATHLIVGRANRKLALELTGSLLTPQSAENAINVHNQDGIIPIIHPYITGKKWFVVDGPMANKALLWYTRIAPYFAVNDDVGKTLVRSYFGRTRYSFGWKDFRFVVGSNPS